MERGSAGPSVEDVVRRNNELRAKRDEAKRNSPEYRDLSQRVSKKVLGVLAEYAAEDDGESGVFREWSRDIVRKQADPTDIETFLLCGGSQATADAFAYSRDDDPEAIREYVALYGSHPAKVKEAMNRIQSLPEVKELLPDT